VPHSAEKEETYLGVVQVLDHMEDRTICQCEGEEILEEALHRSAEEE